MSLWGQVGLQEGVSVLGVEMQGLYDHAMLIMVMVFAFVSIMMVKIMVNYFYCNSYVENQLLETLWTIFPVCLLVLLGLPSIKLLYLADELDFPEATVKVVGHQWYWSYEYSDSFGSTYGFDSYMDSSGGEEELKSSYRLLEVNNRCVVATLLHMQALVTSSDVVHSWAIPSASIKVDGIPGRVSQVGLCFLYSGVFYGQCSELCGVNHSFMPVCVESVSVSVFTDWVIGNHMLNTNNSGNWVYSSVKYIWSMIWKGGGCLWGIMVEMGKWYVWWWKIVFYYGVYIPLKYTYLGSVELARWAMDKCVLLVKWFGWFLVSPIDASVYAMIYIFNQAYSLVWFAMTKPFEFSFWVVKSAYKGIWKTVFFFAQSAIFLYNSVLMSMSSFTDDSFKTAVMEHVNENTRKFLWMIKEYYKSR
uniref:Cytochrome c oxidase subunit 2 n=4 Tax=Pyganodon grandis TaxID=96932 RepID=D2DW44_PYGGR|nr:cytochrome c oxidase subunit II [Pyganodon grandis]